MEPIREITFFGRGGQGAVVASEILAEAYFRQGFHVQSFPSFGVERRGAPVTAFLRVSKEFIYLRSMIAQADVALVFSSGIMAGPMFAPMVKEKAMLVVNSSSALDNLGKYDSSYVDATAIAQSLSLGSSTQPLVNTAMLGAFAKAAGDLELDHKLEAVLAKVPQRIDENLDAVKKAYEAVNQND